MECCGNERILNGVYPFSGFHCRDVPSCVCRSTLVSVWCKGDEPVRVGSKVLCNYEGREDFEGVLEPVGVVVHHDGSASSHRPWVVLVKRTSGAGCDHNYFVEGELKVLDNYDSVEGLWVAIEDIAPSRSHYLNLILSDTRGQFGKVHKELENG